jgi:hypothetical protein
MTWWQIEGLTGAVVLGVIVLAAVLLSATQNSPTETVTAAFGVIGTRLK